MAKDAAQKKADRLAEALRANLRRRKVAKPLADQNAQAGDARSRDRDPA